LADPLGGQHDGSQQAWFFEASGLIARIKALMNLPSTSVAKAS
jgi:hypothetical protein